MTMKARWKWLIILGLGLDIVIGIILWYVVEVNDLQWDDMMMFAENLVEGRKFHMEEFHK